MILPNSTYQEIYQTITQEEEKVIYYLHKNLKSVSQEMYDRIKDNSEIIICWKYYTNPQSKNKYLLWYATTFMRFIKEEKDLTCGALLVSNDYSDRNFYFSTRDNKYNVVLHITSHFLKRYRERCLKDDSLTTEEVIATYFFHNGRTFAMLDVNQASIVPIDEKDSAILVPEGIVYAEIGVAAGQSEKNVTVIRYKTFVSVTMLNEQQDEHVKSVSKDELEKNMQKKIKRLLNIQKD